MILTGRTHKQGLQELETGCHWRARTAAGAGETRSHSDRSMTIRQIDTTSQLGTGSPREFRCTQRRPLDREGKHQLQGNLGMELQHPHLSTVCKEGR